MKLFFLLLVAGMTFAAEWDAIQRIPVDQKIENTTRKGASTRGAFVSASGESIVVRKKSGQRSVARADIRKCASPIHRAACATA